MWFSPRQLNWAAVGLHSAQAIVVLGLIIWMDSNGSSKGIFPLFKTIHTWHNKPSNDNNNTAAAQRPAMMSAGGIIQTNVVSAGSLDVRYVIMSFFALSAMFQGAAGWFELLDSPQLRFGEYSLSASSMILAIGVESGVDDIYTLQAMFVLIFATMMLGILAETDYLAHGVAWITFLSAYSPIIDSFLNASNGSTVPAPGFVHVIVFLQFFLFGCFGAVQTYSLFYPSYTHSDDEPGTTSLPYMFLSLTAKTILAWLILSPIIMAA